MDNQIISSGAYWHSSLSNYSTCHFSVKVHPDHQNGPFAGQMQAYLLSRIEEIDPAVIVSEAKEDETYLTNLPEVADFELKMRFPRSQLDCLDFEVTQYEFLNEQLVLQGIEFVTLTDVMGRDPDWKLNVWKMFSIIESDVPNPVPSETTPFETYAEYYEDYYFRPDSWPLHWRPI